MARVQVVTAYVDLRLTKRPSEEFHRQGARLRASCALAGVPVRCFQDFPFTDCWAVQQCDSYPAANKRAEDRFADDNEHIRSNLIQHSPLQWLSLAAAADPDPDIFVWMGYTLMKQGDFTGKPIKAEHVASFLDKVAKYQFSNIPIPSICPNVPMSPYGDNWQFVGSTLIIPRQHLPAVWRSYHAELINFTRKYHAIPLDLAIWPGVVKNSGHPWLPYPAEYDHTQLTNFP